MNPVDLPREIQDLVALPDHEIKDRLNNKDLVEIFHTLRRDQISHVEKPLAERFLHIIEESTIDPVIKAVLIRDFRNIGGIGTDLSESELEEIIEKNSRTEIISNWSYFSENNKKHILFILIKKNDFGELLYLIDNTDVDLNILSDDGTPLLLLIYDWILARKDTEVLIFESRIDIFRALAETGANLNIRSKNNETLLERAIAFGDDLLIGEITKLGANPNDVDQNGLPLVHLAYKLATERPVSSTDEEDENYSRAFKALLDIDHIDPTVTDSEDNNLFQLAILRKDSGAIDFFLAHPGFPEADKNGYRLLNAIYESDWKEIERLLQMPTINLTVKGAFRVTPLHLLCRNKGKSKQVIAALLRVNPNVNVKDVSGVTPLHHAFDSGNIDVVKVLLQQGARQDLLESRGNAPIHCAYETEQFELIEELLGYELFNPNIRDSKGTTVLQQACITGNAKLVKALLKHPSIDPYFEDNQTERVVDVGNFLADAAIKKVFFAHPKINEADKNGYKLVLACLNKDWKEASRLLGEKEIDPNFKDKYGRPPLLIAYEEANLEVVQALLKRDEIDPNFTDQTGKSFLFRVYDSFLMGEREPYLFGREVFQNLLQCKNTDLNQKNKDGTSLLHLVYIRGNKQLFNDLLNDSRVDPNIEDPTMGSLLALAYKKMDVGSIKKLLSNPRTNPNVRLGSGVPFIMRVFSRDDTSLIDRLLEDDRVDLNSKDSHGHTVLHQALLQRKTDLVKKLLSHERVDPNLRANNGDLIFDEVVRYDTEKSRQRIVDFDLQNPNMALYHFLKHLKLSKADRNGYLLFLAMSGGNWDQASEILKEQEINVHLKPYLNMAVHNQKLEIARELLGRGAIPNYDLLYEACDKNNRELARMLFDAGAEFDPFDEDHGRVILEVLFPDWNWEDIIHGSDSIIEQYHLLEFPMQDVNPLDNFLLFFPDPLFYLNYLGSLTEAERTLFIDGIRRKFPNKALFLSLQPKFIPPEKPKKNLPDIRYFSLERAISVYRKCYDFINFRDPKSPGYVDPEMILDQGKKCSEEELRRYGENFCLYMKDPANSKYDQEKTDSKPYQGLRGKFRYVMYHVAQEYNRLENDPNLTADEKVRIKKNIDNLLMQIASAGNHCMLAKNDVLEEGLDKAYGVGYIPSLANQIAYIVHRYRLGVIEKMFTDEDTDPPQILSHDMYAFMATYEKELGVLMEAFVRDDPFAEGIIIDPERLHEYEIENIPEKLARFVAKELQGRGSEVSPETLKKWLSENPPKDWNSYEEILFDIEGMSSEAGYAYLWRNFSLSPTAEEMLELVNPPDQAMHLEKCREISEEVNQKYQKIKSDKELEIQSKKKDLEGKEGPVVQQLQEEINRIRLEIPLLYAKRLEEQNRRKMSYLQEQGIFLSPKEYVLALKRTEDLPVIKKEMHGKKVEEQWEVLQRHNIHRTDPMEVLEESGKTGDELDVILRELADKSDEGKWEVLAKHKIPNPNPKTPIEALEKYRAQQYANQAYVDGRVRMDRVIALLVFSNQLRIPTP